MAGRQHKWKNPCGMDNSNGPSSGSQQISDRQLIQNIIHQAKIVQNHAEGFKENYVSGTFKTNFDHHHNLYKDKDYDWLPNKNLPKQLGKPVPESHLQSLELSTTLSTVYGYFQQIAVGVEQVVWDEKERNGPFTADFSETENHLRVLLCEILTGIIEKGQQPENVSETIMGEQFRHMDNTSMNLRNWIIFRDYMNMVEYVIEVFEYFEKNLSQSD